MKFIVNLHTVALGYLFRYASVGKITKQHWRLQTRHFDILKGRLFDKRRWLIDVFEGFIDFLSAERLGYNDGLDTIVLNSVSNLQKAILTLGDYTVIQCYLDNDTAGRGTGLCSSGGRSCFREAHGRC